MPPRLFLLVTLIGSARGAPARGKDEHELLAGAHRLSPSSSSLEAGASVFAAALGETSGSGPNTPVRAAEGGWVHTESVRLRAMDAPHGLPKHSTMRAERHGTFTIAQIADTHLGQIASVNGTLYSGSELLETNLDSVRLVLNKQPQVDLAVLTGD